VLISSLKALRREIVGILHPDVTLIGQAIVGIPVIGNDDKILEYSPDSIELANGIGSVSSTKKRQEIYMKFKRGGYSFATIVHPAATIIDYNGPQNLDSVISYTWEKKIGGPSGTNAKEIPPII